MRSPRELVAPAIAVALTAFVLVGMLQRLMLSVEITDESFSTALAYRFALGDRPFVDEINSAQTAGLIITPVVWLYVKVVGSTVGLIKFMRISFLVAKLALAATVFATLKRHLSWPLALVTSLLCVVFVCHSIPNLGYNMLGSGFLTAGSFVAARRFEGGTRRDLFYGGILMGLAAVAYPPFALPAVMLGLVLLVATGRERLKELACYAAGGAVVGLAVAPFLVGAGMTALRTMIAYGVWLAPPRSTSKLVDIALFWWSRSPVSYWAVPALAVVIVGLKKYPRWSVWVLPLIVAALAFAFPHNVLAQLSFATYAGLFAPVFLVLLWDMPFCRWLFFLVWIPSIVAGFTAAFSSAGGAQNGGIGMFPAALVFVVYEAIAVERLTRSGKADPSTSMLALLGPVVVVVAFLRLFSSTVYRDAPLSELTVRVESGPYRGLYTTQKTLTLITELERVFERYDDRAGSALVYFDLPGGFLFTRMRPAVNTVWPVALWQEQAAVDYYRGRITGHGIVVKVKGSATGSLFDKLIEAGGPPIETTSELIVYREPPP